MVREEFREAMDFWLPSRKFWQTVRRLRKGEQGLAKVVFRRGGEQLNRLGIKLNSGRTLRNS